MYQKKDVELAEKIIQLDLLRDKLYEELMVVLGPKAQDLLRKLQNC